MQKKLVLKQPDTYDLLLGQFEAKDCKRVFPKRMSVAYEAGFKALSGL